MSTDDFQYLLRRDLLSVVHDMSRTQNKELYAQMKETHDALVREINRLKREDASEELL